MSVCVYLHVCICVYVLALTAHFSLPTHLLVVTQASRYFGHLMYSYGVCLVFSKAALNCD